MVANVKQGFMASSWELPHVPAVGAALGAGFSNPVSLASSLSELDESDELELELDDDVRGACLVRPSYTPRSCSV